MNTILFRFWEKELRRMSGPHGIGVIYEYLTEEFGKYRSNYVLNWNNIVTMQYTGYDGEDKVKIFDRMSLRPGIRISGFCLR